MKEKKPIYVLGTGLSPHDGSSCLLRDGEIVVAIEKERLTRKKHDGYNDDLTINYCLEAEGITINDLSLIVQCGDSHIYLEEYHKIWGGGNGRREIIHGDRHEIPIVNASHHLAHAFCGIGLAPFQNMSVFVLDGFGQSMKYCTDIEGKIFPENLDQDCRQSFFEKDSFYEYSNNKVQTLFKDFSGRKDFPYLSMFPLVITHSIGDMYEQASSYCLGRKSKFQAGKLMGLAPYGNSQSYNEEIFELKKGRVFVRDDWQKPFNRPCLNYEDFKQRFQYFADIANWVQRETERAILYLLNERFKLGKTKNLVYSGGLALNAVINAKLLDKTPFENLYVTPAAGDNGLAVGCAFYGWLEVLKMPRKQNTGNTFYGKSYPKIYVENCLKNFYISGSPYEKEIVNRFFRSFSDLIRKHRPINLFHTLQFTFEDGNEYFLEFNGGSCEVLEVPLKKPSATMKISYSNFIKWLNGSIDLSNLLFDEKASIQDEVLLFECSMKFGEVSSAMNNILNSFRTVSNRIHYKEEVDIISTAAKLLADGYTIGWFQGGSEFGPRALGHRSILADPRRKDIKEFINSKVKFREDFRPFAPSVLLEDVSKYFHFQGKSPYMLMIAKVQSEWKDKIPGVVHEDNSCRIQTVSKDWNELYYRLIKKFKEYTGISILLNTSFNRRKMPIVESPLDALNFFYECDLDFLVIGDHLISKRPEQFDNTFLCKTESAK